MKKPQLKISLPTDQTMATLNRETVLFHIDSLKRSNCQILSKILNNYWSAAAFDRTGLDHQIILHLIKKVKTNGITIQRICQNQPNYKPWTVVVGRKRKCSELSESKEKRTKKCIVQF